MRFPFVVINLSYRGPGSPLAQCVSRPIFPSAWALRYQLEEAELTEGQGRALSGHKTAQAYRGYAKETFDRALSATRKRHAHRLANETATSIRNEGQIGVRNGGLEPNVTDAK